MSEEKEVFQGFLSLTTFGGSSSPVENRKNNMFSSSSQKYSLDYVRSRELSIFSFFHIDPADAQAYLSAIETIDPQFLGEIVIKTFVKTFCPSPTGKYLFKLLWNEYVGLLLKRESQGNSKRRVMTEILANARVSVDQLTFSCFLVFFMSLQTDEISAFVFWLFFASRGDKKEDQVNQSKLMDLAQALGKSKSEKDRNILKRRLKAVEKLSTALDPSTFKKGKFYLLDVKSGGPFSKPVLSLQNEIKRLLLSEQIWKRIAASVNIVRTESLPAKMRMIDTKSTVLVTHYKNIGERKKTRKDIASFVKIFQEFSVYILTDDDTVVSSNLLPCYWYTFK